MADDYNVSYVGIDGLIDRVVIECAESFRYNVRRWAKAVLKNDDSKEYCFRERAWDDLVWFISGDVETLYPNETVRGKLIYDMLLKEWEDRQKEMNHFVKKPRWVQSMEDNYEA